MWIAVVGIGLATAPTLVLNGCFYPTVLPKAVIGAGLVACALITSLLSAWGSRTRTLQIPFALILGGLYVVASSVSLLAGVDRERGFWGTAERMDGVVFVSAFWALFCLVALCAKDERSRLLLVRWFMVGAIPTFLYAVGQRAGWSWTPPGMDTFASSFGNPAFYATYLTFVFWFGMWLVRVDPSRQWRILSGSIALIAVVFLFLAHSRGAIVGWAVGLLALATHEAWVGGSTRLRRRARLALLAGLGVVVVVFALRTTPAVQSVPGLSRLVRTTGSEGRTARIRLVNAHIALRAFGDRPVLGWGPNSYFYLYTRYFEPRNLSNDPHLYDKVHNTWAEVLCERGLVGLLTSALLLVYLASILLRAKVPGNLLLLSALVTWVVQDAFLFDLPMTRIASMFLLGLIAARDPRLWTLPEAASAWWKPAALVGILLSAGLVVVLGRVFVQSRDASHVAYALPASIRDTTATRIALMGFLDDRSFMNREVLNELCNRPPGRGATSPEGLAFRRVLLDAVREDFDRRPNSYREGIQLLQLASTSQDSAAQRLFDLYWARVRDLGPLRPEGYLLAGERAFRRGDVAEGTRMHLDAARLDSTLAFPWWALGRELVLAGRAEEGRPYVERALAQGYDVHSPGGVLTLIRLYHAVGDTARAHEYVLVAAQAFPAVLDSTITPWAP